MTDKQAVVPLERIEMRILFMRGRRCCPMKASPNKIAWGQP